MSLLKKIWKNFIFQALVGVFHIIYPEASKWLDWVIWLIHFRLSRKFESEICCNRLSFSFLQLVYESKKTFWELWGVLEPLVSRIVDRKFLTYTDTYVWLSIIPGKIAGFVWYILKPQMQSLIFGKKFKIEIYCDKLSFSFLQLILCLKKPNLGLKSP